MTLTQNVTAGYICQCCDNRTVALVEVGPPHSRTLVAVCPDCDYAGPCGPVTPRPRTPLAEATPWR